MHNFSPGDRVVCIDDTIKGGAYFIDAVKDMPNWIKKGATYTIREVEDNDGIAPAARLKEVYNPPLYFSLLKRVQEPAFRPTRFAPVVTTTIETFAENESLVEA